MCATAAAASLVASRNSRPLSTGRTTLRPSRKIVNIGACHIALPSAPLMYRIPEMQESSPGPKQRSTVANVLLACASALVGTTTMAWVTPVNSLRRRGKSMAEQAQQKCSDKDSTGIKTFHTQGAPSAPATQHPRQKNTRPGVLSKQKTDFPDPSI